MKKHLLGGGQIVLASLLFALVPSLTLRAYASGITVLSMLSLKYLVVAAILVPLAIAKYRPKGADWRVLGKITLLAGVFYSGQAVLYSYAVTLIPVASASMILFLYPALVAFLEWRVSGRAMSRGRILCLAGALAGLACMLMPGKDGMDFKGILAALGAALCYAVFVVGLDRVSNGVPAMAINACINLGAAVVIPCAALLGGSFSLNFAPFAWGYILFNALAAGVFAYWLWLRGMKQVGALAATVLSISEPAFASLAAFLLLGQSMSPLQWAGAAVLFLFLLLFALCSRKQSTPVAKN